MHAYNQHDTCSMTSHMLEFTVKYAQESQQENKTFHELLQILSLIDISFFLHSQIFSNIWTEKYK